MCSELCKDFYVVYQLEMVAGEVESSCQLVVTFFFFLVSPYQTIEISLDQPSPPSYSGVNLGGEGGAQAPSGLAIASLGLYLKP